MCMCQGVGAPLSVERTRMLLVLRINVLAKGHSGISSDALDAIIKAFNGRDLQFYYFCLSCMFNVNEILAPTVKPPAGAVGHGFLLVHVTTMPVSSFWMMKALMFLTGIMYSSIQNHHVAPQTVQELTNAQYVFT